MRSLLVPGLLVALASPAAADRELCAQGTIYRGKPIDLDMRGADLHDVYRMLADVGKVNIVLADSVRGKVTMRLRRVPWDQVACTIAAVHGLSITVDGNVLLVRPTASARAAGPRPRTPATRS